MRAAQRGFSLLELLVVVAIIGILVGAVVLSIDVVGADREIEQETQRLRSMVDLLHEEALMQSRDYGLMFTRTGYRFYVYDYKQLKWVEPADDRLLRERALPKPLELALALDDREVELLRDFESQEIENPEPQVMILSSGELTPFELDFYRDRAVGGHFTLKGELDGTLESLEGRLRFALIRNAPAAKRRGRLHAARSDGRARDRRARHDGRERPAESLRGRGRVRRDEDARELDRDQSDHGAQRRARVARRRRSRGGRRIRGPAVALPDRRVGDGRAEPPSRRRLGRARGRSRARVHKVSGLIEPPAPAGFLPLEWSAPRDRLARPGERG